MTMNEALIVAQTVDLNPGSEDFSSVDAELSVPAATSADRQEGRRLYDLLQTQEADQVAAPEASSRERGGLRIGSDSTKTMGEAILSRLDAVGADYKKNVARAYAALEKSPRENTVEDLLKMQLDLAVVSLEVEVVGKGVQKAVQHVDTLSKLQ
jgi:uncharacterized protein YwlG (UPF0340 family)